MSVKITLSLSIFLLVAAASLTACVPEDSDKPKAEGFAIDAKVLVARVNGEPVYESDVLRRIRAAHGDDIEKVKEDPNRWQVLVDVATETEVMDELLLQNAVADGMKVKTEDAQGLLVRARELAGDRAFDEMLEERGSSEEAFRDFLVERELIRRFKNKLFGELVVSDDTLQDYYKGHVDTFAEPDQVRLEIFTFGVRETAVKIHGRWKGGDKFDTIAKEYMKEGERVGRRTRWMPIDAVPAELQLKVAGADAGVILEPTQVADKFYVIRVIEKMGARTKGFEEVKDEISKTIRSLRENKALDEWYKAASQEAKIEYVH